MTCPACGAAMHVATGKDYLICDYCGSTHFPDPNPDGVRVLGEADPPLRAPAARSRWSRLPSPERTFFTATNATAC